jgi:hypothetical protein
MVLDYLSERLLELECLKELLQSYLDRTLDG